MSLNKSRARTAPLVQFAVLLVLALVFPQTLRAGASNGERVKVIVPESLTSVSSEGDDLSGARRDTPSVQSTTGKKVELVGEIEKGSKIEVEIVNGFSHITPDFHENYFHAQVTLALGVNMIDVRWREPGGKWNTNPVAIFRSSKIEGGVTGNYPPYTFHKAETEEQCQQCHRMTLTKAEVQSGLDKNCLKCHSGLTDNLYVHGPVSVGICTVCHDPDSTPNRYKVEYDDNVLCYSCHEDRKKTDESKKLLHGPVGAGMCTVCHDPHGSSNQYQLVKPKNKLCAMCHSADIDQWIHRNSVHPPFKAGNCTGCHDPHSANYKYNLKASKKDLCKLCHVIPIPGHLHEMYGNPPRIKLPPDLPLTSDGKIMCLTCHDPHGAKGNKLTRRSGCDACHPK